MTVNIPSFFPKVQTLLNFVFTVKCSKNSTLSQPVDRSKTDKKKAPPSSWSTTRVDQEEGGAQNFIKAKNGKGQTQFKANLV